MTGYGRGEHAAGGCRAVIELRAVNRKQAEIILRLPPEAEPLEARLRDELGRVIARGRAEVTVTLEQPVTAAAGRINRELATAYAATLREISLELGLSGGVTLDSLLRCPGVLQGAAPTGDPEAFWPVLEPALKSAIAAFNEMREQEGAALARDLAERLDLLRAAAARIARQAPEVTRKMREQLLQRIRLAGLENVPAEDERVVKEIVFYADRSDINEEVIRLQSHFVQVEAALAAAEPVGRKLDFLAQEMNREINTIGSKANDALIAADVVLLKTELERFREQAQNVE